MHPRFKCDKSTDECQEKGRMFAWIYAHSRFRCFPDRMILSFLIIMLLAGCGQNKATREHSRKVLKAFDFELIKISQRLDKTEAFEALLMVRKLPGIQLPFLTSNDTIPDTETEFFNLEYAKGIYQYLSTDSFPLKIADSDSLIFLFDDNNSPANSYKLVIGSYKERLTALGMVFPEIMEATFYKNNRRIGKIHVTTSFSHDMPEEMLVVVNAGRFGINLEMKTAFRRKVSDIKLHFVVTEDRKTLVKGLFQSDAERTTFNTLVYNNMKIELEVFPLKLDLQSDFCFSLKVNQDFFGDFNKNSRITLTDNNDALLGNVKLEQSPGRSRVNLIMYYNDDSTENLEDFLLTVDRILNMKTSFPRW